MADESLIPGTVEIQAPIVRGRFRTHKVCARCSEAKPLSAFHVRNARGTPQSYCMICASEITVAYARRDPEKHRQQTKSWRLKNVEAARAKRIINYYKNHAETLAKMKARRAANPQSYRDSTRAYRQRNPEKVREYERQHRRNNKNARLAHCLRSRLREALYGRAKNGSAVQLLGCSLSDAIAFIESQFLPGMTWDNWGQGRRDQRRWHIDHIKPLSSFDLSNPEQLAAACHHTNMRPLWCDENWSKGNR